MTDEATTLDANDPDEDSVVPDVRNDPVPIHPDDPQPEPAKPAEEGEDQA